MASPLTSIHEITPAPSLYHEPEAGVTKTPSRSPQGSHRDGSVSARLARHREVNRKIDIALLPFMSFLYLFNGLDRGNVGNAQTQGFTDDIGAGADDLNFAVSIFFATFVTFQPISAAMGRWLGPKHWIPFIMFGWGVVTIGQAWIQGRGSLIAPRLLIGVFESGFYATAVAYLSTFYCRYDLAVRIAIFYGQYAIAGAFSGAIAYGVFQIGNGTLKNWQYLFVIEGSLTCLAAAMAWAWLPTGPGTAWFLADDERVFAEERIRLDNEPFLNPQDGGGQRLRKRDFVETVRDWKLWCILLFNVCASVPSTAFSVFLPLVVQGMGFKAIDANLMSVPPYVFGALGLYLFALSSDRRKERGFHIVTGIVVSIVGLILVVTIPYNRGRYVGLCVFLFGSYVAPPLTIVWLSGNTPEPGKRSLVLGVNGWGNLAGVIGSQLYRPEWAPEYTLPFYTTLGFMIVALLGYLACRYILAAANDKKQAILSALTEEEIETERANTTRYADKKWTFLYGL